MFDRITFVVVSLLLFTFSVSAGVLYIEAPEEYSKEQLENPTDNATNEISDFIINEVNKVDVEVADRVVILTKDGKALVREQYPAEEQISDDENEIKSKGYLTHGEIEIFPSKSEFPWTKKEKKSIAAMLEHIIPQCEAVFGKAVVENKIGKTILL